MAGKQVPEPVDCIMTLRGDAVERAPVIWNEITRLQPVEKRKRIVGSEVAFPEGVQLPPWSVSYRKDREVESPAVRHDMLVDHAGSIRHQRRITGKEGRHRISSE